MGKYWLPWLVGMPTESTMAMCSMIFSGVFHKLPKLRVAFAHGGGSFCGTFGRIEHGWRVRPDLVAVDHPANPRDSLGKFWVDSLTHDPETLKLTMDLLGHDKVALGTDYPFPLGEWFPDRGWTPGELIRSMPFDDALKADLLAHNALRWLNLPKEKFV
jgi:aminocarboxymuconate-semialdehyde decarboxylase